MADKSDKKPARLKARRPRGLDDRSAGEIAATRAMVETIRREFERYGFEALETPAIEYTDALGKFLPDQDRPNEGVFSFQDDDEQWLSLRYDLTAPLARYVAENFQHLALPYRSYRYGWVFRNEKPGPGRFRQFMQFDADTVGSASMAADAEMCMLAADTMEALGIPRGSYVVKVNNRKVLDGVMEAIGIGGDENAGRRLTVLRAIDKLDRLGADAVCQLLGEGRTDESGDVTKGAGLNERQINVVSRLTAPDRPDMKIESSHPDLVEKIAHSKERQNWWNLDWWRHDLDFFLSENGFSTPSVVLGAFDSLFQIDELLWNSGYRSDRVKVDLSVVRGLEYYTGPVYEVELLLETKDEKGRPVRFGSVGGGGRYDGLVSRFRGEPCPATGFSIGVSRLQAALTLIGKLDARPQAGPVLVTVFGPDSVAASQTLVAELRHAGIRAELYLGNPKHGIGQQLKYADKRHAPCAVIQGPDEKAKGEIIVRDLIAGAAPSDTADRDAYLKKQAQAQKAVPEAHLVAEVRAILARHKVS